MLIVIACLVGFWLILQLIALLWTHSKSNPFWARWDEGEYPEWRALKGRYRVKIYPRWLWWWLRDIKVFYDEYKADEDGEYLAGLGGHNIAFGFCAWGQRIKVKQWTTSTLLNYERAWWPWRIIRDYVKGRKGMWGFYDGRFCVKLPRVGEKMLSWFTMEKI